MSNLNKKERDYFYPLLVKRDGEFCSYCMKTLSELNLPKLEVHEIVYERPLKIRNMRLLCHSCNHLEMFSKKIIKEMRDYLPEHKISLEKRPIFLKWLSNYMAEHNWHIELDEAVNSGAYITGMHVQTIKNWIRPLISEEGPFIRWPNSLGTDSIYVKGREPHTEEDFRFQKQDDSLKDLR